MKNFTKFVCLLVLILPATVHSSRGQVIRIHDTTGCHTRLTTGSPASPVSCNLITYVYDDSVPSDGLSVSSAMDSALQGNYIPINDYTSGIIKSVDMYFSSNSETSAQPCILYFIAPDRYTIFGQSPSFINTGAPWPDGTWVNVPCPDIPYTGPFYAMVGYTVKKGNPMKNFFVNDEIDQQPFLGYVYYDGVWDLIFNLCYCVDNHFLQRINVCENDAEGITQLTPASVSLFPNPASDVVHIVSADGIRSLEILDYTGQTVYKADERGPNSAEFAVRILSAGTYIVKIVTAVGISTSRLTVMH